MSHIATAQFYGCIEATVLSGEILRGKIMEDSGPIYMARVRNNAGAVVLQAAVTSITRSVYNLDSTTPTTAIVTGTLTIASVIFDTLQTTDTNWTVPGGDSTGYNFKDSLTAASFVTGDARHRIEWLWDMATGENFYTFAELFVVEVQGT